MQNLVRSRFQSAMGQMSSEIAAVGEMHRELHSRIPVREFRSLFFRSHNIMFPIFVFLKGLLTDRAVCYDTITFVENVAKLKNIIHSNTIHTFPTCTAVCNQQTICKKRQSLSIRTGYLVLQSIA